MITRIAPGLAAAVLLGCADPEPSAGPAAKPSDPKPACCQELAVAGELPDLSVYQLASDWQSQEGVSIRLSRFRGRVVVMAMVFTRCEYACPRTMADLEAIEAGIPAADRDAVRFVLVSFDSEHDHPPVLKAWARKHRLDLTRWTLLHGQAEDVRELAAVLGVSYKESATVGFSHSNLISVLGKEGRVLHQQKGIGAAPAETLATIARGLRQ